MSVETSMTRTRDIKELFRPVEQQRWTAREYAAEMIVQVGHLTDIVLRQDFKLNRHTPEHNFKVLGDEIIDVILNAFSVADDLGIDMILRLREETMTSDGELNWEDVIEYSLVRMPDVPEPLTLIASLSETAGRVMANTAFTESDRAKLTEDLVSITCTAARMAGIFDINIDSAFEIVEAESRAFVAKHTDGS